MFTLETEAQRVPGPVTGGDAERSSGNPMPWDLKGRGSSIATVEDPPPLTNRESHPSHSVLYNLHFCRLPPCRHKYAEQPTAPFSK